MKMKLLLLILIALLIIPISLSGESKSKAYMGVYLENLSINDYDDLKMKDKYGILISKTIFEGPADLAGIIDGDVLMELGGDKIYTADQLTKMLSLYESGQKVKLKYYRDKKAKTINFTFGEKKKPKIKKTAYMGIYLANMNDKFKKKSDYDKNYGIIITGVTEDAPAEKAGIKADDILMGIDGDKVFTIDQLTKMLKVYEPEQKLKTKIFRNQKEKDFTLTLGAKTDYSAKIKADFNFDFLKKPDNVFVYQYKQENQKWIGVLLNSIESSTKAGDGYEVIIEIDKVINDTPAEKAGLKAGDIILRVDGKKIESSKLIGKLINKKDAGEKIEIEIERDGKKQKIMCEIAKRKEHEFFEKIELSIDDGDFSITIDGEEKYFGDLDIIKNLQDLKIYQTEEYRDTLEEVREALEDAREDMQEAGEDMKIDILYESGGAY